MVHRLLELKLDLLSLVFQRFRPLNFVVLIEGAVNYRQSEVEQEECTNKDEGDEEEEDESRIGLLVHHHDVGPAFTRDALKDDEQGPEDVIKVCNSIIRIRVHLATEVALRTCLFPSTEIEFLVQLSACFVADTSLLH